MNVHYDKSHDNIATIIRFRDGDTLECHIRCRLCSSIRAEVIRLPGIESWELKGDAAAKALATSEALSAAYRGKSGRLIGTGKRYDLYGRLIADIAFDNSLLSKEIVDSGYGWVGVGNHTEDHRAFPSQPNQI